MRAWSLEKADYLSESECLSHVLLADWAQRSFLGMEESQKAGKRHPSIRYAAHSAQDL